MQTIILNCQQPKNQRLIPLIIALQNQCNLPQNAINYIAQQLLNNNYCIYKNYHFINQ